VEVHKSQRGNRPRVVRLRCWGVFTQGRVGKSIQFVWGLKQRKSKGEESTIAQTTSF